MRVALVLLGWALSWPAAGSWTWTEVDEDLPGLLSAGWVIEHFDAQPLGPTGASRAFGVQSGNVGWVFRYLLRSPRLGTPEYRLCTELPQQRTADCYRLVTDD